MENFENMTTTMETMEPATAPVEDVAPVYTGDGYDVIPAPTDMSTTVNPVTRIVAKTAKTVAEIVVGIAIGKAAMTVLKPKPKYIERPVGPGKGDIIVGRRSKK